MQCLLLPKPFVPIYAVNKLGGICFMIHPLSPAPQIEMYLNISHSRFALTLDAFYSKFAEILKNTSVEKLILTRIPDYLKGPIMKFGFWVKSHKQIKPVPLIRKLYGIGIFSMRRLLMHPKVICKLTM